MSHTLAMNSSLAAAGSIPKAAGDRIGIDIKSTTLALLLLLPIYLLVLQADKPSFYLEFGITLFAILGLCTYLLWRQAGWLFPSLLVAAICFQNLYLGTLLNFQPSPLLMPMLVLIETKTAILYGGFVLATAYALRHAKSRNAQTDWGTMCGVLFICVLIGAFLFSPAPLFSRVANLRNLLAPVAAWYFGRFCVLRQSDFRKILRTVLTMGILLSIASAVELASDDLWGDYLQKDTLLELKGPTADETDFGAFMIRRLYTGVGSPINASFIFALLFLLALFVDRYWVAGIFGIQALLTFSKAGIAVAMVGITIFCMRTRVKESTSCTRALWLAPFTMLLMLLSYLAIVGSDFRDATDYLSVHEGSNSVVGHLRGLVGGIVQLPSAPWGHGLGVSGNMSELGTVIGMTGTEDSDPEHRFETGGESTIGTILYQLGLLGFISFAGWSLYRIRELFYACLNLRLAYPHYADLGLAAMAAMVGGFTVCFISESAMVPQTGGIIFLLGGIVAGTAEITHRAKTSVKLMPHNTSFGRQRAFT
jgi:hypothetical protein